ncbi:hypothetical protein [Legionella cincinnatiensis]|uniref:Uncharacterized protein n=1 Tax=Legionella cincinnatiensis TaxID=28085 RepID=A0A378IJ97_9GAMM|nr:hypothetical protein [Legionella cincinnatiensis]KTC88190.1 hypothetical protein Lcin_1591 [Legionella cincinnatiensis]STX34571.1 Uncharacterised protein [Legionella cincinnatiensis]
MRKEIEADLQKKQEKPLQNISTVDKLYIIPYYELMLSLPAEEREYIITELDSDVVIERAQLLCKELSQDELVGLNIKESRILFLAALRNLREGKISVNQLATLHILDSAIRTLYVNPMIYFIHKYVNDNDELTTTFNLFSLANLQGIPTSVKRLIYNAMILPKSGMSVSDMPWRMRKPLMQRFFNFNNSEWSHFCEEMAKAPSTEQFFHILVTPEEGCWSSIIANIQKVLKCMRVLDWLVDSQDGLVTEKIMLVPSFSMFQAAINAKAKTLGRNPVELIPTYGYVDPEHYADLKSFGKIAMAMYMPEKSIANRYQNDWGGFRTKIDGHPSETAFAGAIHDVYHAMREIAMSENVAKARMRLAWIAKNHPQNFQSRPVDEILVDGELIHSYPPDIDTVFDPEYRSSYAEAFGDLFYVPSLKPALHKNLKRAFIEDMVVNKEEWEKQYHLGKSDLRNKDQKIYEEIESQQLGKPIDDTVVSFRDVQTMNRIGFLGNNPQRNSHLDSSSKNLLRF